MTKCRSGARSSRREAAGPPTGAPAATEGPELAIVAAAPPMDRPGICGEVNVLEARLWLPTEDIPPPP